MLRYQRNPFDPLQTPSPLVTFKGNLAEVRAEEVAFTVEGSPQVTRFPVATLAVFDGVVWAVADGRQGSAGRRVPTCELQNARARRTRYSPTRWKLTFTIGRLRDPWLPRAGWVTSVESERANPDYRLNIDTGTLAVNGGLRPGEQFTVRSRPAPAVEELDPALGRELGTHGGYTRLPDEYPYMSNLFNRVTEGSDSGLDRMLRISRRLVTEGFYTDGNDAPPGHSYRRISTFLGDLTAVQGYGEQYAAAAAVLARAGGVPTRVVLGYQIEQDDWQGRRRRGSCRRCCCLD